MSGARVAYAVAVGAVRAAAPLAGASSKLARALRGRAEAGGRLQAWAERRDSGVPLAWVHASSVGEGHQAGAVLSELRPLHTDLAVLFTYSSPSAQELAHGLEADRADYLPWDAGPAFQRLFQRLAPRLVVFTQREVWPGLVGAAHRAAVPSALVAATLPEGAARLRWPARWLLRGSFGRLTEVHAINDGDADRFRRLGVDPQRVTVTGDPGIDSAWSRAAVVDPGSPHLRPFLEAPAPTLVAGSTWPADEAALLPAVAVVRAEVPDLRVVIAPHEPTADHVDSLVGRLESDGWAVRRLSTVMANRSAGDASAVVVDSVGLLAQLYAVGTVAFVGGAFDRTGIHSVLEPAAAGLPVSFGPLHQASRAAGDLLHAGGARVATSAPELAGVLTEWLASAPAREAATVAARTYVEGHRGAARRSAQRLATLLADAGAAARG
jgi:3-deoxy-D-manno-octulosonic-acid transferase